MITGEDRPRGPRAMAEDITVNIAALQEKIAAAGCPKEQKRQRRLLRLNLSLIHI